MSDSVPPPAPSPQPPKGPGETTQPGVASTDYVKRKLEAAELHMQEVAREAARIAAREEHNGKPVISKKLTPWFFAGYTLGGAVTAVVVGDPDVPSWVVKAAAISVLFFGGLLGIGSGWRK